MKIDIHTHTKKCKTGDAHTREVSAEVFCQTILSSDVGIVAITNHNVFDREQFFEIQGGLSPEAQVWPGIELDVLENGARGHLLVIVSPTKTHEFSEVVDQITRSFTPDTFTATIAEVIENFDALSPLYVAHYKQKKPNISDDALEKLVANTENPGRVIKEVTNSISAGIYISHGHASIYGSDVQDWATYEKLSRELPDLRLPVDSFEHFCLLLEKDPTTINTVLDRKTSEDLSLRPFDDNSCLDLKVYNDINVFFGPKGTGKSCILKAIAKHYSTHGTDARVYESASDRLDQIFDTKGKDLSINLNNHGINYCSNEIEHLRSVVEVNVTNVSKYVSFFKAKSTNKNAKKLLLKDITPEEEGTLKREFIDFNDAAVATEKFLEFLSENSSVKKELDEDELEDVVRILTRLNQRLHARDWTSFSRWKEVWFLNCAIATFRKEVERKTGIPAKPTTTGFREYALNRVEIEINAAEIIRNADTKIPIQTESLGSLGSNKGSLEFRTEFKFQDGGITSGALSSLTGVKKGTQKKFIKLVRAILANAYSDELFHHIAALNATEDVEEVHTVYELLLFERYFALDGQRYTPSSGEASMVMLQRELGEDKEIYILDEPERSLGNEYINDVIVPLVKEHARVGKKVFISTHDANIAVRTLPYSSVYRCHGASGYSTYCGNPFSNNLVDLNNANDHLDWKQISMKTLEGGEEAFGERGKIYGNY
ncbi:hypothetical protein [Roseimaritima ulvae]|uniref:Uncharacterized protein n=1 Tax=Roseimaritima ulvae TaxID=980254 RepID=A0A5B9QR43_9BACT|nr:hypothetical protein [Roseimaritima ulvae]QEG40412.1 hypothetical protein UC8_24240 [Roseimaritima ulvae]